MPKIDAGPAELDLIVREGDRLSEEFVLTEDSVAVDLTGWTLESAAKPETGAVVEFTVTVDDAAAGMLTVSASAATLASLPPSKVHWWHLTRTDSGFEDTWVAGRFIREGNPVQ